MATVRALSLDEQNAAKIAGLQYDTAVYGTAAGTPPVVRLGRDVKDGGYYIIGGVQTASNALVILDLPNAFHGGSLTVKRAPAAISTSVITVVSGSAAGGTVGTINTSVAGHVQAVFDGTNQVWR